MTVAGLLALALTAACGNGSSPAGPTTTVHVAVPVGAEPSKSAQMVCSAEAQRDLGEVLGVQSTAVTTPTWVDDVYSCRYVYPTGTFTLSVKELADKTATTAYFDTLEAQLGNTGTVNGLGQGAFSTTDGSMVVRKDYKVLLVDVTGLPARFGVPPTAASDVAVTIADVIMGCWSGS
jgi:hypothetical protein